MDVIALPYKLSVYLSLFLHIKMVLQNSMKCTQAKNMGDNFKRYQKNLCQQSSSVYKRLNFTFNTCKYIIYIIFAELDLTIRIWYP